MTSRNRSATIFSEHLDCLMPKKGGYAVMLKAYYDASERESGVFCVAGVAFDKTKAKPAEKAWPAAFDGRPVHMTDLHNRHADFADITREKGGQMLKAGIDAIKNRYAIAVAVSCNVADIKSFAPKTAGEQSKVFLDGFKEAYAVCAHVALIAMATKLAQESDSGDFCQFFEQGDKHQDQSVRFMAAMTKNPFMKRLYRHRSHAYIAKEDAPLLSCADVLAWEWAKHVERVTAGSSARPSLESFLSTGKLPLGKSLEYQSPRVYANHLRGDRLKTYFEEIATYILDDNAPIQPDVLAALTGVSRHPQW